MAIHPDQPPDPTSRAQRKLDLEVLRQLGTTLVELPPGKFAKIELPDSLRDAVALARRLTDKNARRRQIQLIQGEIDCCDTDELRANLALVDRLPAAPKASTQSTAPTADDLLALSLLDGGDPAVFALSDRYDSADLQTLRQAVRRARKDLESGRAREMSAGGISKCLSNLMGPRQ